MAFKDIWEDRINGVDKNSADDINEIAHGVIANEENIANVKAKTADLEKNALKEFANIKSGNNILVKDSAEKPLIKLKIGETENSESVTVKVQGANLWKPWGDGQEKNGVTLTVDENGVVTLNGKCTQSVVFTFTNKDLLPAGTYCLSDSAEGNFPANTMARTHVYFPNINESLVITNNTLNPAPSIVLEEPQTYQYRFRVQEGHEYVNCKLYPMLNIGSTALPYETYKEPQTITVSGGEVDAETLKNIHTYYPSTTITNDSGAHMELEYVTDAKNYIDNKFAELSALLTPTNEIMTTQEEIYD